MTKSLEPKPLVCPFCGSSEISLKSYDWVEVTEHWTIRCSCFATGPEEDSESSAILAWNRAERRGG
jgi:Lar family restriction alleviation protein